MQKLNVSARCQRDAAVMVAYGAKIASIAVDMQPVVTEAQSAVDGRIVRAVVDDDDLNVLKRLPQSGRQRPLYSRFLTKGRNADRHKGSQDRPCRWSALDWRSSL